ncbi:hypothetical protein [Sphingomonas sp. ABOLE]|uniref:hypothetical protein n=1 Tax=Sphingomonas sp. ABOLE TaxID=1985878 RepID=UPI000F7DB069|nr:hypothetical protein [Sphingomonas sp. ABOLE]
MNALSGDFDAVLRQVWPGGVPKEEEALLALQSPERAQDTVKRLKAILRLLARDGTAASLAAEAGISRRSLFDLRDKWLASRSLSVLVPHAKPNVRKPAERKDVLEKIGSDLKKLPTAREIAMKMQGEHEASMGTLRRLVRDRAREQRLTSDALLNNFGSEFAIDVVAVDMPIITRMNGRAWPLAVIYLEKSTGLVLSAALIEVGGSGIEGVIQQGAVQAHEWRLSIAESIGQPVLDVVLPKLSYNAIDVLRFLRAVETSAFPVRVDFEKPYRFGRSVINAIGGKLGRFHFRPRATDKWPTSAQVGDTETEQVLTLEQASALFGSAVTKWNAGVLLRLKEVGLVERGDGAGPWDEWAAMLSKREPRQLSE